MTYAALRYHSDQTIYSYRRDLMYLNALYDRMKRARATRANKNGRAGG